MENNKSVYETINQYYQKQMEIWEEEKESQRMKGKLEAILRKNKIEAIEKSMCNLKILFIIVLVTLIITCCALNDINDIIRIHMIDSQTIIEIGSNNMMTLISVFIFPYLLFLITFIINKHTILYKEKVILENEIKVYSDEMKIKIIKK